MGNLEPAFLHYIRELSLSGLSTGWPTDFTSPVKVFYAALEGLGNLLRLASQSKAAALVTFIFASSCGVFRSKRTSFSFPSDN